MTDVHDSVPEPAPHAAQFDTAPVDEPPPPQRVVRRRKLPFITLVLSLAAAVGVGFFAGVRVEKAQISPTASSAQATGFANASREAAQGRSANPSPNAGNQQGGRGSRANGAGGAGAGASGAGGGVGSGVGGGTSIVGTVATVDGQTLYVTESSGDTVKVTTSDGTTVTKTVTGAVKDLTPGETVVVLAVPSGDGVYAAQSVTAGGAGGFGGRFGGGGRGRPAPSPSPNTAQN